MKPIVICICVLAIVAGSSPQGFDLAAAGQESPAEEASAPDATALPAEWKPDNFDTQDIVAANTLVETLHIADWLGPLAPVALSPFFGLACLSGLAIWGPEWVQGNALLSAAGPLKSEVVFAIFLTLTVLTSVPRMSKVSKPFAQSMDQVETYSVIIILLVIKFLAPSEPNEPNAAEAPVAVVQFGFLSFTAQSLLLVAMVFNLVVINSVKFFFEILIWLTPVPAIDALFEIGNKAACFGLMSLYAFSPTLATLVNLLMLAFALVLFRWANRRLTFYRTMFLDPLLARIWRPYGRPSQKLVAFPKSSVDPFVAKSRWRLSRDADGWVATRRGFFGTNTRRLECEEKPLIRRGWLMHTLSGTTVDGTEIEFHISRRHDARFEEWTETCGLRAAEDFSADHDLNAARIEFG